MMRLALVLGAHVYPDPLRDPDRRAHLYPALVHLARRLQVLRHQDVNLNGKQVVAHQRLVSDQSLGPLEEGVCLALLRGRDGRGPFVGVE